METTNTEIHSVPPKALERAIRMSYAQAIVSSISGACTGGIFAMFALKLGASDVQMGLLSTVPNMCVVFQLVASSLIERGLSRRLLTIGGAAMGIMGWAAVAMLPFITRGWGTNARVGLLLGILTAISILLHLSSNARSSWVGDLIPSGRLGSFFGKLAFCGGVIGAILAIAQSTFLDSVKKNMGISGFSMLFGLGVLVGLLNTSLYLPQPDVPVTKHESSDKFLKMLKETLRNRSLLGIIAFGLISALSSISGPFYAVYVIRDLKAPYTAFGILQACNMISVLVSSAFWGRIVDRYGCRPVLIACTAALAPISMLWFFANNLTYVYAVIIPVSFIGGFLGGGIGVAMSTLIYRVTPSIGRSMYLAIYSVVVTLLSAPMPTLGGLLTGWIKSAGIHSDVRITIYIGACFTLTSAFVARRIKEPESRRASELIKNLPGHIARPRSVELVR